MRRDPGRGRIPAAKARSVQIAGHKAVITLAGGATITIEASDPDVFRAAVELFRRDWFRDPVAMN
jgi:hypothetical protein